MMILRSDQTDQLGDDNDMDDEDDADESDEERTADSNLLLMKMNQIEMIYLVLNGVRITTSSTFLD